MILKLPELEMPKGERLWTECGHRGVLEVPLTGDLHSRWMPGKHRPELEDERGYHEIS